MKISGKLKVTSMPGDIRVQTMSGEIKFLGDVGPTGPQGEQGIQGPQGIPGPGGVTDYNELENKPRKITNLEIEAIFNN